jgi:hypothetical protein
MSTPRDRGNRCRGACTGACLDRHACQVGRQSWSARPGSSSMALTRGARSGSLHVSRGIRLPAVLAYQRRQLPTLVGGPCRVRPRRLVGLPLRESSPSGVTGLHPRHKSFQEFWRVKSFQCLTKIIERNAKIYDIKYVYYKNIINKESNDT